MIWAGVRVLSQWTTTFYDAAAVGLDRGGGGRGGYSLPRQPERDVVNRQALVQAGVVIAQVLIERRGITVKAEVPSVPAYSTTRREYYRAVRDAVGGYLESGDRSVTKWRNTMGRSVLESFSDAFYRGYRDVGGEDTEADDEQWLTDRQHTELGFVSELFQTLRDTRDTLGNGDLEAINRAEGYTATLDSVYAEGKLRGAANVMLTWRLGRTEQHCRTCSKLNGQRHSAKWWLKHGLVPRQPGSETLECHGYNCDCRWVTDSGKDYLS